MSGGSMDYVYSRIEMAAEEVQEEIRRIEEDRDGQGLKRFKALDYYREKYPDNQMFRNEAILKHAVLKRMRDAVLCLKKAAIYARRVEWLSSADDGYEAFVLRTDNELKQLENSEG